MQARQVLKKMTQSKENLSSRVTYLAKWTRAWGVVAVLHYNVKLYASLILARVVAKLAVDIILKSMKLLISIFFLK